MTHWSIDRVQEARKDVREQISDATPENEIQLAILLTLVEILAELRAQRKT